MIDVEVLHREALRMAKAEKDLLVRRLGLGTDIPPSVIATGGDRRMVATWLDGCDRDDALKLATMLGHLLHPEALCLVIEGYERLYPKGDPGPSGLAPHELARRFAGGEPEVVETVMVNTVGDGALLMTSAPYRYEGRTVRWDGETTHDSRKEDGQIDGIVAQGLHDALGRTGLPWNIEEEVGPLLDHDPDMAWHVTTKTLPTLIPVVIRGTGY